MTHVSDTLNQLREELVKSRDSEISMASEVMGQYVTDHNDAGAYREIDREVNRLAKAWDRMIAKLEKWEAEAVKIEGGCENFYGD
jgi:hypothetical protein